MGREVLTGVRLGSQSAQVKAHLTGQCIELRGGLRVDLAFDQLSGLSVADGVLHAQTPHGALALTLGEKEAALWLKRILAPPALADKLGLKTGVLADLLGRADAELEVLLAPWRASPGQACQLYFLALDTPEDLDLLDLAATSLPGGAALWTVRTKGKSSAVSETALRDAASKAGWTATKTASFSPTRSADRWHRKRLG